MIDQLKAEIIEALKAMQIDGLPREIVNTGPFPSPMKLDPSIAAGLTEQRGFNDDYSRPATYEETAEVMLSLATGFMRWKNKPLINAARESRRTLYKQLYKRVENKITDREKDMQLSEQEIELVY